MKQEELVDQEPFEDIDKLIPYLECTDHTVSRETFSLLLDPKRDLLVTIPRPSELDLPSYYESEAYISHTDSRKTLMDRAYQMIKAYSLKKKLRLINKLISAKGSLLDIGCGTGDFLSVCEKGGWEISGIEPSQKARELAEKKIVSIGNIKEKIDEISESKLNGFDMITMWHVLEHVPNLLPYIEKLKKLLSRDGYLIIAVPNFKSYDAQHYKKHWAAYDVPRHLWHFSEKSIRDIFGGYDFEVIDVLPLVFDSFYVSLLSEKYKSGKPNFFSGLKTGLISNLKARHTGEYSSKIYVLKKR